MAENNIARSGLPTSSNTWIVIPCYNEGSIIADTILALGAWLPNIVAVDDGSADNTSEEVQRVGAHLVRHPINLGQGAALETGIRFALLKGAEYVVSFDADGQHQAKDIDVLIRVAQQHCADVVLGSRFLGNAINIPPARRWLLNVATAHARMSTGLQLTDAHNGLRLLNRKAAQKLRIRQDRMAHASELLRWLGSSGLRVREAPVDILYSDYSLRKGQTLFSAFDILWDLCSSRLYR